MNIRLNIGALPQSADHLNEHYMCLTEQLTAAWLPTSAFMRLCEFKNNTVCMTNLKVESTFKWENTKMTTVK